MKNSQKKILIIVGINLLLIVTCIATALTINSHKKKQEPVISSSEDDVIASTQDITLDEYYKEELALDDNEENVLIEEDILEEKEDDDSNNNSTTTTSSPYYIKVNRQANCVTVYEKDENGNYTVPVKAMVCSVGLNGGTPTGVFKTTTKYYWRALYGNVYGQYAFRINGPILFHSVPYYTQNKWDLESEEYNKLGQAASMGCVRLAVKDAKWLIDHCPQGTMVEIYDAEDPGPLGKPNPVRIDLNSPNKGWDPTDPDDNNPWKNAEPVILGVTNKNVERGQNIDLLSGITATDYLGNALTVTMQGLVDINVCGAYQITYTATASNGKSVSATATITVSDTVKPVISLIGEIIIDDSATTNIRDLILEKLEVKDGTDILSNADIVLDVEELESAIAKKTYGSYSCSATIEDASGNLSDKFSFKVTYTDAPPTISVTGTVSPITLIAGVGDTTDSMIATAKNEALAMVSSCVTATDAKDGTIVPVTEISAVETDENGMPSLVTVKVIAEDSFGNQTTKNISVTISVTKGTN